MWLPERRAKCHRSIGYHGEVRCPVAELRTTLFAALAVGCGTTTKDEATPSVVVTPDPPRPAPTVVATSKKRPPPAPELVGYQNDGGAVNRLGPSTCSAEIPQPQCKGTERHQRCKTDADCTEHPHGRCTSGAGQIGTYCGCQYSCTSDDECGDGEVCVCGDAITTPHGGSICAPAACTKAADCGDQPCGVSSYHNGCGRQVKLQCRGAEDACESATDCKGDQQCVAAGEGFSCRGRNCAIGRPLRVAGELRAAEPRPRSDWHAPVDLTIHLSDDDRRRGRRHYLEVAALEHGSVGSFARFTLQLLALGAPAHLLAETQAAALDEVRHAQLMYGVASALGAQVGPGPLAATDAPPTDPATVLEALVEEGCVGETLGAVEAAAAAVDAVPTLAGLLTEVADDETRHAALAWRTLVWMLETWPEHRPVAAAAFERALARLSVPPTSERIPGLGILPEAELTSLRRHAVDDVVRPLARRFLD